MVSTRSQTNTLSKDFSKLFILIKGDSISSPKAGSATSRQVSPKRGAKRQTKSPKSSRSPIRRAQSKSPIRKQQSCSTHGTCCPSNSEICFPQVVIKQPGRAPRSIKKKRNAKASTSAKPSPENVGNMRFPSRAWGERETVGLSKIGRADKEVEIWEEVYRTHEINEPRLLPIVERSLQKARKDRAALDETLEENVRIGDPNPGKIAIEERIKALEWALSTSKFGLEVQNIRAAITGYLTGLIPYSDHYTLMYAGQVVDTALSYGEFAGDRQERLDRYALAHGPHWLWWEPPLNIHPEAQPKAMLTAALDRIENHTELGDYHIFQGYWKRAGWVNRMAQARGSTHVNAPTDAQGRVNCQNDGPQLSFRSLLDSGATFPSLHTGDLARLGIDYYNYSAQSVCPVLTAAGPVNMRLFELWVCVLSNDGAHLVDANEPAFPNSNKFLGSLCPVLECVVPITTDANGMERSSRLSGMLPFVACYISSTPTQNIMWLGEDRNDVLGFHRMPGQKKWDIETGHSLSRQFPVVPEDRFDNPKIRFNHQNGQIIDEDDLIFKHCSHVTYGKNTMAEKVVTFDANQAHTDAMMNDLGNWKPMGLQK